MKQKTGNQTVPCCSFGCLLAFKSTLVDLGIAPWSVISKHGFYGVTRLTHQLSPGYLLRQLRFPNDFEARVAK